MLEVVDVHKAYGKNKVLCGVNFTMKHGVYGLLGLNGAGKTTLLNIMTGILQVDDGIVKYHGTNIRNRKSRFKDNLGFMPQYTTFYPKFTAREFLKYMCVMKNIPRNEHAEKINKMLEYVNLSDAADKKIGSFSGGMRQRVGIAQALINNPEIIIMDEPTAGLDPAERIRFRQTIENIAENKIVLIATHIIQDVEKMADNVLLLSDGKIVVKEQTDNMFNELESFFTNNNCR